MGLVATLRYIRTRAVQLNLFESAATRSNPHHLHTSIVSTRLYLILMTIAVFILVLFTALAKKTQTVTIQNPSQDVFQALYSKYSTTLQCPCSQLEIPYETFINISYDLHPVCSSVFVSDTWINLLSRPDIGYFFPLDFRSSGSGQFQLLASLCLFANRIIQDAIDDFLASALLSPQALSSSSLTDQSETRSQFLNTSTTYTFRRLLNLIRGTTNMNGLQPAMQTTSMELLYIYPNHSLEAYPLTTIWVVENSQVYEECFCDALTSCYYSAGFFDLFDHETQGYFALPVNPMANVTGFLVGCYALDGLLNSSLECFFDSTCLSTVLTYFPVSNVTNITTLNINQTKYSAETTIGILVNNIFLEDWSSEISFSAYYSECAPILCTYKFTEYNSILQILTTLLGVYGGLTVVLRICIPRIIRWWRNRKRVVGTDPNHIRKLFLSCMLKFKCFCFREYSVTSSPEREAIDENSNN
jgi:hypothetical protein